MIEIKETVDLPEFDKKLYIKEAKEVEGEFISYKGYYKIEDNKLYLSQTGKFGKRIYNANEWEDFKSAVKYQKEFSKEPVILQL